MSLVTSGAPAIEHLVVSLIPGGFHAKTLRDRGICVTELALDRAARAPIEVTRLARLIGRVRPDIVQGWMYHGNLAALLGLRLSGRRPKTPLVWGIRCSDVDKPEEPLRVKLVIRASAQLSPFADVLVANSYTGLDDHARLRFRSPRQLVIHNGVDTGRFRPDPQARAAARRDLGLLPTEVVIAHVARVHRMKDHASFVEALKSLPGVRALAIGAGTEQLPDTPGLLRLGRRADVPALLAASDIIASSSTYGEGFSNAVAEGMAAGLVPIATDCGDARYIIGDTGSVVPVRSPDALARALDGVRRLSPPELGARGARARDRICRMFGQEVFVQRFADLYSGLSSQGFRATQKT